MRRITQCLWQLRWVRISAGCALVVCGLLFGFIPFLPGFLIGIPGLAILSREFPQPKKYSAPFERILARLKQFWGRK